MPKATDLDQAYKELGSSCCLNSFLEEYYLKRDNIDNIIRRIVQDIVLRKEETSLILFLGFDGSGKSTEICQLQDYLLKQNFRIVSVSLKEFPTPKDLYLEGILLLLARKTIQSMPQELESVVEKFWFFIYPIMRNKKIKIKKGTSTWENVVNFLDQAIITKDNVIKEAIVKAEQPNLRDLVRDLIDLAKSSENKILVFIIDDLDKEVHDHSKRLEILRELNEVSEHLGCFFILTVPFSLKYFEEFQSIGKRHFKADLPIFRVLHRNGQFNDEEINLMKEIVYRRVERHLIPEDVISNCAKESGGIVRDFLEKLRECCNSARAAHFDEVRLDELTYVKERESYQPELQFRQEELEKFKDVYNGREPKYDDDIFRSLIDKKYILHYYDQASGNWYYDINPKLKHSIAEKVRSV
jgi:predicted kinase